MDGLTLVRKIRALNLPVPIVLRTAMENLDAQAREAGVDLVLPWFRWRDLGAMVKELVHCHASGKDNRP
jgi:CheY-like chemotaxis protein